MFKKVIEELQKGNGRILDDNTLKNCISNSITDICNSEVLTTKQIEDLGDILHICNIVYNNIPLDDDQQFVDNGTYDILLEKYKVYCTPQVGAEPVQFTSFPNAYYESNEKEKPQPLIIQLEERELFYPELFNPTEITREDLTIPLITMGHRTGKKYRIVSHNNPNLVGTLDKCKCVLCNDVEEETLSDPSYKIFERDFLGSHIMKGIINPNEKIGLVLELKYDGISVVVTVKNKKIINAVSRGDTGADKATDLTPILEGYTFDKMIDTDTEIDVKCEAVMTYQDLYYYNLERNKDYKNCRSAIIGLFSSNDGYLYQRYVTLIPLAVAPTNPDEEDWEPMNRLEEISFINKYLSSYKEFLRYSYVEGTYNELCYLVKRFVDEAEYARPIMPTMYDGVVVSYLDENIREALGRDNFVNKYSVAIKFDTMKKQTTLLAITYTVGKDGTITPMAHYAPVEFIGTIHTKSSISSVERFNRNHFKIGNVIQVEYRNDVMPYVTTPDIDFNKNNPEKELEFIKECPVCGHTLIFSKSAKSAKCPNINCKGRRTARLADMLSKLGIKDFGEARIEKIDKTTLKQLLNTTRQELEPIIGPVNAYNFVQRMNTLKTEPIYDFQLVGSIGFSGLAIETWKKIFSKMTLQEFKDYYCSGHLPSELLKIKGIGQNSINTIMNEYTYYENDIETILSMSNVVQSKGLFENQKSIRVSGFRDQELMDKLNKLGYDASDKSVTKSTNLLIIPYEGYTSSKLKKIGENTIVVAKDEFLSNMDGYLSML